MTSQYQKANIYLEEQFVTYLRNRNATTPYFKNPTLEDLEECRKEDPSNEVRIGLVSADEWYCWSASNMLHDDFVKICPCKFKIKLTILPSMDLLDVKRAIMKMAEKEEEQGNRELIRAMFESKSTK